MTPSANGINLVYKCLSVTEIWGLLRRDHDELERLVLVLADPMSPIFEVHAALENLRIGFAAHADGEAFALRTLVDAVHGPPRLEFLVSQIVGAHLAQEGALAALAAAKPGTTAWRDHVRRLHELMRHHDEHQNACVIPTLREQAPPEAYRALAGSYATERLRALAMMHPTVNDSTYMHRLRASSSMP